MEFVLQLSNTGNEYFVLYKVRHYIILPHLLFLLKIYYSSVMEGN
jgi:hypothetical protein